MFSSFWHRREPLLAIALAGLAPLAAAAQTTLVTTSWDGSTSSSGDIMSAASLSETGQYVAFASDAGNLVQGDANNVRDVFVFDRFTGARTIVSVDSSGTQADALSSPAGGPGGYGVAISRSGRFVAFNSWATNLVAGDINAAPDVFVHDRDLDGNLVFDETFAGAIRTIRVNIDSNGTPAANGSVSHRPVLSADGRHVAFFSTDANLVANDTNGTGDVFVHDRDADCNGGFDETFGGARRTVRVSVSSAGVESNGSVTWNPSISADGRYIIFESDATNLVSNDANNAFDIFLHDRDADGDGRLDETAPGATSLVRVSVASNGAEANSHSTTAYGGGLSADGRYVVFDSSASNLVAGDTNNASDVFVRDVLLGVTTRVSVSSSGAESTAGALYGVISPDGQYVAFQSCGQDLAPLPPFSPNAMRMYLHDRDADGNGVFDETFAGAVSTAMIDVTNGCPPIVTAWQAPRACLASGARCAVWSSPPSGNVAPMVFARDILPDRDGDGLLDTWEINGIDGDGDGNVDFTLPNANPDHRDLYVEVDAMNGRAPAAGTLNAVVASFANAPVMNPDGQTGITLHLQLDELTVTPTVAWTYPAPLPLTCPNGPGFPPEFCTFKAARFGTLCERQDPNSAAVLAAKALTHRYGVFADRLGMTTISGLGELPGNDFIVTLGAWPQAPTALIQQQREQGVFMHELGHNLGLHHGGAITDSIPGKPNYHSVMNYSWTVPAYVATQGAYGGSWILDFSAAVWPSLDELALNEPPGIGGHVGHTVPAGPIYMALLPNGSVQSFAALVPENGPVDWNRNGVATNLGVAINVNQLPGANPQSPAGEFLCGHDDWSAVRLPLRGHPNFGNGVSGLVTAGDELTYEMVEALSAIGDCNANGIWDQQEIDAGTSADANANGLPDECEFMCGEEYADDFEEYLTGDQMHGLGGWKGWDNNAAAGAMVAQTPAHTPLHSLQIAGPSDLVHEYCTDGLGVWSVSMWQYIPSDFSSNSTDALAGSYVVMLNRYDDGGPHNAPDFSVQVGFDSNSGMVEAFHGAGLNTINVPYQDDRWVKFQVIVDLDSDWTRVYYDDALVTEYPWTGGVLGGGGGALDIAAVDLYANGASPVYYDDLRIVRGCGVLPFSDVDGDGLDLLTELRAGTDSCSPDSDTDGLPDGFDPCPLDPENDLDFDGQCGEVDNCPLVPNPLQADGDADGYGDACDLPGDANHDGDVDLADHAVLTACWSGPVDTPSSQIDACLGAFDADLDADVDLGDYAALQAGFTGS